MRRTVLLKEKELNSFLKKYQDWKLNPKKTIIHKIFNFDSHVEALVFIARVTVHAEVLGHHPDIDFSYKKVKVKLTTHDLKGLTKKDVELAKRIEVSSHK